MIPSKRIDRLGYTNPLGSRAANGMWLILAAVLTMGLRTGSAEQPQVTSEFEPTVTISDNGSVRKDRKARRLARSASEHGVSTERRRKRSSRNGPDRLARQVKKGNDEPIQLHLSGSYELNLGNDRFVRGEGSTTIKIDRATAEKLRIGIVQSLHEATPASNDLLKAVASLPASLNSTSEILKSLSDPETQKTLRQVEQLLRMIPQSSPQSNSQK
tara:strand:+ start:9501 stop:10145 length:645 start_codon:yes stop_codon:yes gene_type:complete